MTIEIEDKKGAIEFRRLSLGMVNDNLASVTFEAGDRDGLYAAQFVSDESLIDMLTIAFEGGVGYWCFTCRYREPRDSAQVLQRMRELDEFPRRVTYPVMDGGAVILHEQEEGGECTGDDTCQVPGLVLDRRALARGLAALAAHRPSVLARAANTNFDAEDGDAFLQMALFQKVVYG